MEPLTLAVGIATLDAVDELAAVAARTFPLACPPSTPADNIASFIDTNLTATRFAEYLADPRHAVLTARHDARTGDRCVEAAVAVDRLGHGHVEPDLVADVGYDSDRLPA